MWPKVLLQEKTRQPTVKTAATFPSRWRRPLQDSNLRLPGYFERNIDLDARISHCRIELGVTEQQSHGPEVPCPPIDQRCLGPSWGMGPIVASVQSRLFYPVPKTSGVLPGSQTGRLMEPVGKKEAPSARAAKSDVVMSRNRVARKIAAALGGRDCTGL